MYEDSDIWKIMFAGQSCCKISIHDEPKRVKLDITYEGKQQEFFMSYISAHLLHNKLGELLQDIAQLNEG